MSDAPVLAGLNSVSDLETASDFEKKHLPYLECSREGDKVNVTVKVGHWVSHPNQPDHFIQWIAISVAGVPVARFDCSPVAAEAWFSCGLTLDPGTEITAMESCNLHGVWANTVTAP